MMLFKFLLPEVEMTFAPTWRQRTQNVQNTKTVNKSGLLGIEGKNQSLRTGILGQELS